MLNPLAAKAIPYALLAVAAIGFKVQYDRNQRAIGAAEVVISQTRHERDSLRAVKDSLAVASHAQVETLRVAVIRRIPIRDTVERFLRDTVPVPVEVVREIVRADSLVIRACTVALGTCEQEKAALRRDLFLSRQETDAVRRLQPSGFRTVTTSLRDAAIGAALCYFLCPKR